MEGSKRGRQNYTGKILGGGWTRKMVKDGQTKEKESRGDISGTQGERGSPCCYV